MKYSREQIKAAEKFAYQQLDGINHSDGYYNLEDYVYFYHKGRMIIDPWQNEDCQYGGCLWPEYDEELQKHIGEHVVEPFEYYGSDKMGEYIRRILVVGGSLQIADSVIAADKKVLDFLKCLYFGNIEDPLYSSIRNAYTDMCRTIRYADHDSKKIRELCDQKIQSGVEVLLADAPKDKDAYTRWHYAMCNELIEAYEAYGIDFTYGQAQKWINMTMKYLYVLEPDKVKPIYGFLHIPLDNYIIEAAKRDYGITPPKGAWSRIKSYDKYIQFEENLIGMLHEIPLDWEFRKWIEEASRQKGRAGK